MFFCLYVLEHFCHRFFLTPPGRVPFSWLLFNNFLKTTNRNGVQRQLFFVSLSFVIQCATFDSEVVGNTLMVISDSFLGLFSFCFLARVWEQKTWIFPLVGPANGQQKDVLHGRGYLKKRYFSMLLHLNLIKFIITWFVTFIGKWCNNLI